MAGLPVQLLLLAEGLGRSVLGLGLRPLHQSLTLLHHHHHVYRRQPLQQRC